ncbi:MAG: DUF4340 domain-containing protein [Gemmataceae bacterium]
MNFRTTYILFGAVAVLLVVFLLMLTFGTSSDADDYVIKSLHEAGGGREKIAELKKSIERLEVERLQPSGEKLVFARSGDTWKLESPYEARVDKDVIERAVGDLVDARIDKKADITHKLESLGLDNPSAVITLRRSAKEAYHIKLGNVTSGTRAVVFALVSDRGKEPVAIPSTALASLFKQGASGTTAGEDLKSVTDFRPRNLLGDGSPLPWESAQRVELKQGDREVELARTADGWQFAKPADYGPADMEGDPTPTGPAVENIAGVRPLLTAITGLRIGSDADVVENPPNFAEYGVADGKESFGIMLTDKSGVVQILLLGNTTDNGEKTWARLGGEQFVVKLPTKALEPIKKVVANPMALRDRNLATFAPGAVDAIDISLRGEKKFELRRVGPAQQWRLYEVGSDSFENASQMAVMQLLNKLTERRIVKEFPDSTRGDAAYGLEEPVVEIAIWQDGILPEPKKDEEKKDDAKKDEPAKKPMLKGKATIKFAFGKKEKDLVYVRRFTSPLSTLVAVPESVLAVAARPRVEYLDLTLPSFDLSKVTKLTFNRGPEKFELDRDAGNTNDWKIAQPPALAGRAANAQQVEQMLLALQRLTAEKIVAAKATDAELERFGLKTPRIEATVTQKDGGEKLVYQFGAETEDKLHVYAKLGGKDRVFHIARIAVNPLEQGEIQDLTVFRVDPAKVTGLKMTGWKQIVPSPVTLEFARKGPGEWSCKQDDKDVDSAKVERFVQSLALVRAEKFLTHQGKPTPEMKLDAAEGGLAIELTVEGEKEPITLAVGAPEAGGKTRYATSSKAPGAIFLLYKERFDEVKLPNWYKK